MLAREVADADASSADNRRASSFNFSKFPCLQEVYLATEWIGGDLCWLPGALSTIKPATSPRLSTIRLNFFILALRTDTVKILTKDAGDDLRLVANEVARIEREFGGAVKFTVFLSPGFVAVLDALKINVGFHFVEWMTLH